MLTIPLVGFLVVTGVQVASSIRTATQLDAFASQVVLGRQINALVHELQRERDRTVGLLAATDSPGPAAAREVSVADLAPDRTAVDRAAAAWADAARPLRGDPTFDGAYRAVETRLADLPRIREGVGSGWLREAAAFDAYTRVVAELHALLLVPAAVGGDAELSRAVRTLVNASRAKELTAQIRGLLFAVCGGSGFGPGEFEIVAGVRAQRQAALAQLRDDASAAQLASWDDAVSGQAVRNASRLEQTVIDNASAAALGVDAQQWWQASTTQLELIRGAEQGLLDAAIAAAEARGAAQRRSTQLGTAGSVLLLLVALLTSFAIGRTMVATLHSLREQALDVAQRRLPEVIEQLRTAPKGARISAVDPIAIRSGDEVGEVAEAFTAVHRNAVRLATEQALMRHNVNAIYVNLARRSQTLVERQLKLLDTLESAEADPDQLANLFRLDHLATRMRRNDDNLLVLAGGDASRRWTDPVALPAVVLAAAAEIEHYPRVRHDIADDIHVAGHVVADLVHLLAELLENATLFSPSQTTVTVLGWASDEAASLVIQDEGMGMSAQALARANRQVRTPVSIDVAAAERMGLVVVGHLAHRHGIGVRLSSQDSGRGGGVVDGGGVDGGVVVTVRLPAALLAHPSERLMPWTAGPAQWLHPERAALPGAAGAGLGVGGALVAASAPQLSITAAADPLDPPTLDVPPFDVSSLDAPPLGRRNGGSVTDTGEFARPAASRPGVAHRRAVPTRAEDVLGAGRLDPVSHWWSGQPPRSAVASADGSTAGGSTAGGSAVGPPPTPDRTGAGLPMRVPMTHLPQRIDSAGGAGGAGRAGGAVGTASTAPEADPEQVGNMLSQFYGGVHRAAAEQGDDPPDVK